MKIAAKKRTKLVEARKKLNLSQYELAHRVNIDRAYLTNIENGKGNPSLKVASRIAKELNMSVDDLFL